MTPPDIGDQHTVLFVCAHGAGKSRMAAAWFDAAAPAGWRATTAGMEPSAAVSDQAARLLTGTPAAACLDTTTPRAIGDVGAVDLVVGIDCAPAPPAGVSARSWEAETWELESPPGEATRDELRQRVEHLVSGLTTKGTG